MTAELRELAIRTLRKGGVTQRELAEELGVSARTLRVWMTAANSEENNAPLKKAERVELEELRAKAKRLEQENLILKKFQAFSAKRKR